MSRPTAYDARHLVVPAPRTVEAVRSDRFFTNTKGPVPRLCCRACPRSALYDRELPGVLDALGSSHRCGPDDGRWFD